MPPTTWPSASSGFMIRPASSTATSPPHAHRAGRAVDLDDRRVRAAGEHLVGLEARPAHRRRRWPADRRRPPRPRSRPSRSCGSRTSRRRRASRSVSPVRTVTRSGSTPSLSAAIWANSVSWPCPVGVEPTTTSTSPSSSTWISAHSYRPPERSTDSATPVPTSTSAAPRPAGAVGRRRPVAARRWRAPRGSSAISSTARSRQRSKSPESYVQPSAVRYGNERTRLRRRSSTGSIPSSRAAASSVVSIR